MPGWVATLLVGVFTVGTNLLVTAFYFGKLAQRVEGHDESFENIKGEFAKVDSRFVGVNDDQRRQWHEINEVGKDLARVKGRVGVNGDT